MAEDARDNSIGYEIDAKDDLRIEQDPLTLELDDATLVRVLDKRVAESERFFNEKYNLKERRRTLEKYLFGRQMQDVKLKKYELPYVDNLLWEIEASIKPLAFSKLPDLTINPGNPSDAAKKEADEMTKAINGDLKKRDRRKVSAVAFKHLPVYFTAVVKARWDPTLGEDGDYDFEVVHPENIVVDHTATANDEEEMDFITHYEEATVKEVLMRFPGKKEKLLDELKKTNRIRGDTEELDESQLASKIKIAEVWFRWYTQKDDQWEQVLGVAWKYEKLVLKKMKNPNWDYEGGERLFRYANPNDATTKEPVNEDAMRLSLILGQPIDNLDVEKVYYNYLDQPAMPFFFLGYDQWGKMPYDETSRLEQILYLQQNLDKRGDQITKMLQNRGKHIWSRDGGLKAETLEEMDMNNPNQDALVDGDINTVHGFIPPEMPPAPVFEDYNASRERMFAKAGVEASRGEIQTDVATSNQIAREADYNRADDLVEETVNALYEWMAHWSLHFIKLRYTQNHLRRLMGEDGQTVFMRLHRDMIDDGMEVTISASATDKLKAQQRAQDMAQIKLIDPLNYYKDVGASDPQGRTEALMLFMTQPNMYIQKYAEGLDVPAMAQALNAPPQPEQPDQSAPPGGASPDMSQPQQPVPENTQQVPAQPPTSPPNGSVRNL